MEERGGFRSPATGFTPKLPAGDGLRRDAIAVADGSGVGQNRRARRRAAFRGGPGPQMLSGFNTNVRHKGVLFHVQTEDSGRDHPHVITHLFHGGNILASEKRSYAHLLEEDDALEPQVKCLMDEQHGAMLEKLRGGAHDRVIRERLGSGSGAAAVEAADLTEPPTPRPEAPPARPPSAAPPRAAPKPAPAPAPAAAAADEDAGDRQRPLDEVVLDYLLESARQRLKR